jgi:hypothetical protein
MAVRSLTLKVETYFEVFGSFGSLVYNSDKLGFNEEPSDLVFIS